MILTSKASLLRSLVGIVFLLSGRRRLLSRVTMELENSLSHAPLSTGGKSALWRMPSKPCRGVTNEKISNCVQQHAWDFSSSLVHPLHAAQWHRGPGCHGGFSNYEEGRVGCILGNPTGPPGCVCLLLLQWHCAAGKLVSYNFSESYSCSPSGMGK